MRPKREEGFYWSWACHEAHVKCLGSGLLGARGAPLDPVPVEPIEVAPGYAAAIAVRAAELPPLKGWTFGSARPKAG